tara:strand:- start:59 stop:289 length:231 start_codon:yes stop_codon:yes gene_type:complete
MNTESLFEARLGIFYYRTSKRPSIAFMNTDMLKTLCAETGQEKMFSQMWPTAPLVFKGIDIFIADGLPDKMIAFSL